MTVPGSMRAARCPDALPEEGHPEEPAAADDARARLQHLYQEQSPGLIRQLALETGCAELARELAHDAFLRMLRLPPAKALKIGSPGHYLRRISTNLLRDRRRERRLHRAALERAKQEAEERLEPVAVLESRDTLRRLEAAISSLKPKTREIFLAHRLDGLSHAEIAERTGLSISGVEKQMIKAIARIDKILDRC